MLQSESIGSSSIETAKTTIIITYLAAASIVAVFGAVLARIAQRYVGRAAIDRGGIFGGS